MSRRLLPAAFVVLGFTTDSPAADFIFGEDFEGVPACNVTGFDVVATPVPSATLGTQTRHLLKVRACGVSGSVTLGIGDIPPAWTPSIDNGSFTLADGQVGVALLTMKVPTNSAGGIAAFNVTATHNVDVTHGTVGVNVIAQWILHFAPDGTGSNGSLHVFPTPLTIKVGSTIRLISDDTTDFHLIHADGGGGLVHQNTAGLGLAAGQEYDMTLTAPTGVTGHIYCHFHGGPITAVTVVP